MIARSAKKERPVRTPAFLALVPVLATAAPAPRPALALSHVEQPWRGDLDGMIERRMIRALVVYSKTFYFIDRGAPHGTSYDTLTAFEAYLNGKLKRRHLRVHIVFIPVSRDQLLPALLEGRGDIAAANLTITPARRRLVDFSDPFWRGISEVLVTGPGAPPIRGVEDLSGRKILVRASSSYFEHLARLNERLRKEGKPRVQVELAPEHLEDEDLLEMVNAGLIPWVIVDSHKATFWAKIFTHIRVHEDVAINRGGEIAWAFRHGSPELKAAVNQFVKRARKGTLFGNTTFTKYLESTRWVENATSKRDMERFERTVALFKKYARQYDFDWLMLAAMGYQESRLNQNRRSPDGAIGVMQVMPATGKAMDVGDIRKLEPNIHAGVKYMRRMLDRYFDGAKLDPLDRNLFAFAAYNAGPTRIASLRRVAAKEGLDPDVWFGNVERVAAEKIGRETVQYVSNIYKYYVAYRLARDERELRERAREKLRKRH
jgi:membrane-bound lytic murein transglycosylase MltF